MKLSEKGCENLGRHLTNIGQFGVPTVVAINRFTADTDAEMEAIRDYCAQFGADVFECTHWANGGAGAEDLAQRVVEVADSGTANFAPLYPDDMSLWDKINTVATKLYGATGAVAADARVMTQLKAFEEAGYGNLPVCMAKTQYSFSTDASKVGAPSGHSIPVREVRLSAGAGFIVAICGEIMTMPGLPRQPAANTIRLNDAMEVEGLF